MSEDVVLSQFEARELAVRACLVTGASQASARSLVDATLSAAIFGPPTLGFPHFVDYLNAFAEGRIKCDPTPTFEHAFPAYLVADADGGIAQLGFDLAFTELVEATRRFGVAVFTQTNSYTAGELGYYVRRLAGEGIIGLAAANANAMVAAKPGGAAVYSTNPMAFGFPLGDQTPPLIIDQASSATAYVNIVRAAAEGQPIPEGWAVDENGLPTQDAAKALAGALLPFGGRKGGNVALFVEMLSAGLSGGPWSLDAPDFRSGDASPAVGLSVIAIMPGLAGDDCMRRAHAQTVRLHDYGVFIPGVTGIPFPPSPSDGLKIPSTVFEAISRIATHGKELG
ncbi:Ldh family oxidoreductase [Rhizobium jaguaris]|uniref:Malate dehydrogenase n=1 Tax=Rhizobium jaguaris TaxID=1312183 RepID=A0A387G2M5_9HYPH|nr:Ldh family oxidoreductase [Rhizobium jaguaris]AYG61826.1 malate dehydrogenase [Rhizobium jaguaris]